MFYARQKGILTAVVENSIKRKRALPAERTEEKADMYKIKMGTKSKLMRYLHPGRETLRKAALYSLIPVFILSIPVIISLAHNSFVLPAVLLLFIICMPLFTAYHYSSYFLSFLREAEDRKAVLYDFVNSSRFMEDNVRLGDTFIFPRNGQIPFSYASIHRIDLGWVSGKGYGIVITTKDSWKFILCEKGALPLTRGEGMERYRPFIRELQRHIPEIVREFGKDEKKNRGQNGYAEESQARVHIPEHSISDFLRPPEVSGSTWLPVLFIILIVLGNLFIIYRVARMRISPNPVSGVLVACLFLINIFLFGFQFFDYNIAETLAKIRDFELRMQSFQAEGLYDELLKDYYYSVPCFGNHLRFGEKYLFLRQEGAIYEYSGITKAAHLVSRKYREGKEIVEYYYKITERGDERTVRINTEYTPSVFMEADQELRKKIPGIVIAPLAEKPKRFI